MRSMDLQEFLARFGEKAPRTAPWSVPYAYFKLVEIYEATGEYAQVVTAADIVLEKAGDSRYGTLAHMSKIEALAVMGDTAALATARHSVYRNTWRRTLCLPVGGLRPSFVASYSTAN